MNWHGAVFRGHPTVDDQVAGLFAGRRIATAESRTAGMLAAWLTDRAGSSAYVTGGWWPTPTRPRWACSGRSGADRRARRGVGRGGRGNGGRGIGLFGADTAVAITGVAGWRRHARETGRHGWFCVSPRRPGSDAVCPSRGAL